MAEKSRKKVRALYQWERDEFSKVFGDTLDYSRVRVHENTPWPDLIDRIGRSLKGMDPPGPREHNAITLGNHCIFPVDMPEELLKPGEENEFKHEWLVHELTHAWQYQHMGWNYLVSAIKAQLKLKGKTYEFGGEEGLLKSREKGLIFKGFNPEQQGRITETYYRRMRRNQDVQAWEPYIDQIKSARKG